MNKIFIISQLIGIVGLFYSLKAFFQKKKDIYAKNSCLSAIFNIIHYFLLNAYSGVATKVMALTREFLLYIKARNKKYNSVIIYVIIISLYILLMLFLYDNNFINLLPLLSAAIYFTVEWFGSIKSIRIVGLITTFLWLIYNIIFVSITGIMQNVIVIVALIVAIINVDNKRKAGVKNENGKH